MTASRSNRPRSRRYDDADWRPDDTPNTSDEHDMLEQAAHGAQTADREIDPDEPQWSSYRDALKGPDPIPDWVVRDPRAIDHDLGVMKSGKEADVSLLRRSVDDGVRAESSLLAVKRYRSAEHRLFHRDAGYLEGRRVRRSRENRAMATRTTFGRELIAEQWANAEFHMLGRLWSAGASVPYPVQLIGTELMMEFIGDTDAVAAPRLAQIHTDAAEATALYLQLVEVLHHFADAGYVHGDLSAYNVLVHDGRVVVIDLPQAVDVVANPLGFDYLRRDCQNICTWFSARGVRRADADDLFTDLSAHNTGSAW
jgi:RIO kinase 1